MIRDWLRWTSLTLLLLLLLLMMMMMDGLCIIALLITGHWVTNNLWLLDLRRVYSGHVACHVVCAELPTHGGARHDRKYRKCWSTSGCCYFLASGSGCAAAIHLNAIASRWRHISAKKVHVVTMATRRHCRSDQGRTCTQWRHTPWRQCHQWRQPYSTHALLLIYFTLDGRLQLQIPSILGVFSPNFVSDSVQSNLQKCRNVR